MMVNDSPQIQAIRARFRNSFNEKKQMIDTFIAGVEASKKQGNDALLKSELESCHAELHKLAGSFGMYGYSDVAETCRAGMKAISDLNVDESLIMLNKVSVLLSEFDD